MNVTFAVARTETLVYVPAGTRMLTMCASAERAVPEQSLVAFAPGRTVPVHVTLVLWPLDGRHGDLVGRQRPGDDGDGEERREQEHGTDASTDHERSSHHAGPTPLLGARRRMATGNAIRW